MRNAMTLAMLTILLTFAQQAAGQRDRGDREGGDAARERARERRDRIEQKRAEAAQNSHSVDRADQWIERTQRYVCGPGCDYAGALVGIYVAAKKHKEKAAAAAATAATAACAAACNATIRFIRERREAERREGSATDRAHRERERREAWERLREKEERMHPPNRKATLPADKATLPAEIAEREMFYVTATSLALLPLFDIPDSTSLVAPDSMRTSCYATEDFGDLECQANIAPVSSLQCRAHAVFYLVGLWYSQFLGDSTYQVHLDVDCGESQVIIDQGPRGLRVTQSAVTYRRELFSNPGSRVEK